MILKLLIGLIIVVAGWWLWRGPARVRPSRQIAPILVDPELAEAYSVLGIDETATDSEIRIAYRRIAASVHPDRGGSVELARRVNAARDTLLKRRADHKA